MWKVIDYFFETTTTNNTLLDNYNILILIAVISILIIIIYIRLIRSSDYFEEFFCPQKNLNSLKYTSCNNRLKQNNLPNSRIYFGPVITKPNISCSNYLINPNNIDKKYLVSDVCHGIKDTMCNNFYKTSLLLQKHYLNGINKFNPNYNLFNPV